MYSFSEFLIESQEINLSKKIFKTLSSDAQKAIESWESVNWIGGALENHFKNNTDIAKEILSAFEPIAIYLKRRYGNSILLYRGLQKGGQSRPRVLESWTSDKRVAEHFAGLRKVDGWRSMLYPEISDREIQEAIKKYEKSGFVEFRGKRYVRNKEAPEYYNIFDRNRQFVTDGDNIEEHLRSEQQWISKINKEKLDNAILLERRIPIDDIVWITNNLDSKEFIVKAR